MTGGVFSSGFRLLAQLSPPRHLRFIRKPPNVLPNAHSRKCDPCASDPIVNSHSCNGIPCAAPRRRYMLLPPIRPSEGARAVAYENFIGGAWKAAGSGATDQVLDPATGQSIAEVPSSDANDVEAAVAVATRRLRNLGSDDPAGTQREAAGAGRRRREEHRRAQATRDAQRRQASVDHRLRVRPDRRQPSFLCRRSTLHGDAGRRRVHGGSHVDAATRPTGRLRRHRPVELPAQHGHVEARARRWPRATPSS